VNLRSFVIAVALAIPAAAQTQTATPTPAPAAVAPAPAGAAQKVAVIQFQEAVLSTQEGQQASATLKAKYDPRKTALERRQAELESLQDKLQKGAATMSHEAQTKAQSDLANGSRNFKREADDLNAEVQEEEGKIMQAMATKMGDVIQKYAAANGFSVVLDVSSQQTPVLWASQASNITSDIVKQYDTAYPVKKAAAAVQAPAPKTPANQ
jgi:outer membrane protein